MVDAHILYLSAEHSAEVKELVYEKAFKQHDFGYDIPRNVAVVGNNWLVGFSVEYMLGDVAPWNHATSYSVAVNSRLFIRTPDVPPLDRLLRYLCGQLSEPGRLALLPVGELRTGEAKLIGILKKMHDDWYDVLVDNSKIVRVFPLLPGAPHR